MGYDGNLVFEPDEITISAGESVHFVNNMLPPHNVVVEDHPEISHEGLAMMPGEEFDVTFADAGDYTYWCGPHTRCGYDRHCACRIMQTINRFVLDITVAILDFLYQGRDYQRFWVLEEIARAPYFAFLSVLHFRESMGLRGPEHLYLMKQHFEQSVNETEHLEYMESRGGNNYFIDRFVAKHLVLVYYWSNVVYYWMGFLALLTISPTR